MLTVLSMVPEGHRRGQSSLQAKGAGLFYGGQQLLVQHGERGVGRQVEAIKTRVSPEMTVETQ